ncbi:HAD family hydrolase [Nocardia amikacinitolerans]|uniref:HAD family hydrolase n=1 Tax=Nocardia amikacinitolerans TaxID=756689 RepID=UPI0036B3EF04
MHRLIQRVSVASDAMAHSFTVAFDIGNTLVDVDRIQNQALDSTARALAEREIITSKVAFKKTYFEVESTISGPAVNHLFSKPSDIMSLTLSRISVKSRTILYFALSVYRDSVLNSIRPQHGLTAMLRSLRQQYRLAIISDGSIDDQILTLHRMGIIEFFDPIVISEEIGVMKPDKKIFEALIEGAGTPASHVLMVGNDSYRDIAGAKQAGMRTVWVKPPSHNARTSSDTADATISFDEVHMLEPIVDRIFGEENACHGY